MKKIISLLLSIMIVLTTIPLAGITSFADEKGYENDFVISADDLEYEIISEVDKTCKITKFKRTAPYTEQHTDVYRIPTTIDGYTVKIIGNKAFEWGHVLDKKVIIPNTVVSIGDNAFNNCNQVPEFVVPDTVESIGIGAFSNCDLLKKIVLPSDLTVIPDKLFEKCQQLETVIMSQNITEIGDYAFSKCEFLKDIIFPESVTSIGAFAFDGCKELENIVIPKNVSDISDLAFANCTKIKFATLLNSVTNIGAGVFEGCISLEDIIISKNISDINENTFKGCTSLKTIYGYKGSAAETYATEHNLSFVEIEQEEDIIYSALADGSGCEIVKYIGNAVNFIVPSNIKGLKISVIGKRAFQNHENLNTILLPAHLVEIKDYAFKNCISLSAISFPKTLIKVGAMAFNNCSNLENVTAFEKLINISKDAFDKKGVGKLETFYGYPGTYAEKYANENGFKFVALKVNNVFDIKENADKTCTVIRYKGSETDVVVPDKIDGYIVKEIGPEVFAGQTVTSVTLPVTVTKIGNGAFRDCYALKNITMLDAVNEIGVGAFAGCLSLDSVKLPANLKNVADSLFEGCVSLVSVDVPNNSIRIGKRAFAGCSLLSDIELKNSALEVIEESAFANCSSIVTIDIPNGVTTIGDKAFEKCSTLAEIVLPNSIRTIGTNLFDGCKLLKSATLPNRISEIPAGIFNNCIDLAQITIPKTVEKINRNAFNGCQSLKDVVLPENLREIEEGAFNYCTLIKELNIPNSLVYIGDNAFNECSIEEVLIPETVKTIGTNALTVNKIYGYENTEANRYAKENQITFVALFKSGNIIYIEDKENYKVYKYVGNEEKVIVPESVNNKKITSIGSKAFVDCQALTEITMFDNITNIEKEAFVNCPLFKTISGYPGTYAEKYANENGFKFVRTTKYPDYVYNYNVENKTCEIIKYTGKESNVVIPSVIDGYKVTKIGGSAFNGSTIVGVTIPDTVINIGPDAFLSCELLKNVKFGSSVSEIGSGAFANCKVLTDITLPIGLKKISASLFENCTSLVNVSIPNTVTSIENKVFAKCSSLTDIIIPTSVNSIAYNFVDDCNSLVNINVNAENKAYKSISGVLFNKDMTELIKYPAAKTSKSYEIPNTVINICQEAFENASKLVDIEIPESVTNIGIKALYNCTGIKKIAVGKNVVEIGTHAIGFYYGNGSNQVVTGFEIHGSQGSTAELFAKKNNIKFVTVKVLTDKNTNVSVKEKFGGTISDGAVLSVKKLLNTSERVEYKIDMINNGSSIDLINPVILNIPVLANMDASKCRVYYVDDNGIHTRVNATLISNNGNFMQLEVSSLGKYVITTKNIEEIQDRIGDIDNNGIVNDWDSVLLDRYLAGWDIKLNKSFADIDHNGTVNDWDGVLLARKLAGWNN